MIVCPRCFGVEWRQTFRCAVDPNNDKFWCLRCKIGFVRYERNEEKTEMVQTQKIRGVATEVKTDAFGTTTVRYHSTIVVEFNRDWIVLDSGSWRTATTKLRMNQTSNQFDLEFQVFQRNHEWFVSFGGVDHEFVDGMVLFRHLHAVKYPKK